MTRLKQIVAFSFMSLCLAASMTLFSAPYTSTPAEAVCQRHAFIVNDFGKEGPIRMARENLYKFVEKLKKEKNIKHIRVKESKPSCFVYLDVGLFNEHTCRIEASMCW